MEETENGEAKPRKTWFIERKGDGHIFATDEHDAWNMLTDKSKWRRHDFKIAGVSNGETYFKIIREGKSAMTSLLEEKNRLTADLQKYLNTEDRLRFTELKDDSDEMVIKVLGITKELNAKIAKVDEQLKNFNKDLIQKAFDAELEIARGNTEFPTNHDIITPVKADREKILGLINR